MKNNKVLSCFFLFFLLILNIGLIQTISAREYLLKTESAIEIIPEKDKILIKPLETKTIPLTIKYIYGRLARQDGFPFPRQKKPVKMIINLTNQPQWCLVSIDQGSFEIPTKTFFIKKNEVITLKTNLTIQNINPHIPAFETCIIKCKIQTFQNGNIKPSSNAIEILIEIDKITDIEIDIDSTVDLFYGDEETLYLFLKNIGNLNLSCIISTEEDNYLDIKYDKNVNLDINEGKIIPIIITNKSRDNINKTIKQKFIITADAIEHEDLKNIINKEFEVNVNLLNNTIGEKMDEDIIIPILIFISIIFIIGPIIVTYLFYKKRQNLKSI
jgi:hypothetical protein